MSVLCDRPVVFFGSCGFPNQSNWLPRYNWNIVESGVRHHNSPYLTISDSVQFSRLNVSITLSTNVCTATLVDFCLFSLFIFALFACIVLLIDCSSPFPNRLKETMFPLFVNGRKLISDRVVSDRFGRVFHWWTIWLLNIEWDFHQCNCNWKTIGIVIWRVTDV